jgi:5-methylcytosine-specific restriction endonuclease McrA
MTRTEHRARKNRESLSKRLGKTGRQIKARDAHRCVYCGASHNGMHLDHLTPRSKGGEDTPQNLATACRRCNCSRQDMTLAQWAAYAQVKFGLVFTARQIRGQARRRLPAC